MVKCLVAARANVNKSNIVCKFELTKLKNVSRLSIVVVVVVVVVYDDDDDNDDDNDNNNDNYKDDAVYNDD